MTEWEWVKIEAPWGMIGFLRGQPSDRKLRLFACACCRRLWHLLANHQCRRAVEVSERFADGLASRAELAEAYVAAKESEGPITLGSHRRSASYFAAVSCASETEDWFPKTADCTQLLSPYREDARRDQISFLHDILGPLPFRPVTLNPAWLTWNGGAIPMLAQSIYDERAFDRMPALADALVEAGCTNKDVLTHCRGGGNHVRGCWVVDLLLGKG